MKNYLVLTCCFFLAACGMKERFDRMDEMNADMIAAFHHKDIDIFSSWGTDEEDNYVTVLFYNFAIDKTSYNELDSLASKASEFILKRRPPYKKLNNVEIRFTKEENVDSIKNLVIFNQRSKAFK